VSVKRDRKPVRTVLFIVLALGLTGTALELFLLDHVETLLQSLPVFLIGMALAAIVWHLLTESPTSRRVVGVTMVALIASGALGVALHYRASVEFQKDVDPTIQGFTLLMTAIQSKAPPALAPAAMVWFGLLGLVCTYLAPLRRENI
jgi:hypothetical protein